MKKIRHLAATVTGDTRYSAQLARILRDLEARPRLLVVGFTSKERI